MAGSHACGGRVCVCLAACKHATACMRQPHGTDPPLIPILRLHHTHLVLACTSCVAMAHPARASASSAAAAAPFSPGAANGAVAIPVATRLRRLAGARPHGGGARTGGCVLLAAVGVACPASCWLLPVGHAAACRRPSILLSVVNFNCIWHSQAQGFFCPHPPTLQCEPPPKEQPAALAYWLRG